MEILLSENLRPKTFEDLVLDELIKKKLQKMYDQKNIMNMLFYGKPGCGKTSAAKILTDRSKFETLTINGSLDTSIDIVRTRIMGFARCMSLFDAPKICFVDEADYLSKNSQASLRGVIEETSSLCRFIFTANSIEKMHPALLSRLLVVNFDMTPMQIETELEKYKARTISEVKKIKPNIDESRIKRIIEINFPDYRTIASKIEFELL